MLTNHVMLASFKKLLDLRARRAAALLNVAGGAIDARDAIAIISAAMCASHLVELEPP